jgi:hypothetical protein
MTDMEDSERSINKSETLYSPRRGGRKAAIGVQNEMPVGSSWAEIDVGNLRSPVPLVCSHDHDRIDTGDDDMFSIFQWSSSAVGREQFLLERSHYNHCEERENGRNRKCRTDEVVALFVQSTRDQERDVDIDNRRGRRAHRGSKQKAMRSMSTDDGAIKSARERRRILRSRSKDSFHFPDFLFENDNDDDSIATGDKGLEFFDDARERHSHHSSRRSSKSHSTRSKNNDGGRNTSARGGQRIFRSRSKDSCHSIDSVSGSDNERCSIREDLVVEAQTHEQSVRHSKRRRDPKSCSKRSMTNDDGE